MESKAWQLTNIGILVDIYKGIAHYYPGVGSSFGTRIWEGATGAGVGKRIKLAYSEFVIDYEFDKHVDIIGFSRGAATAREFANVLSSPNHKKFKGYKGCPVDIRFVGLFDTVDQTMFYKMKLRLPDRVKNAAQVVSRDEQRVAFPVTRIRTRARFYEEIFPGDHSDIGRGHNSDTNILSIAPLEYIYNRAKKSGVPFGQLPSWVYTYYIKHTPHDLSSQLPWSLWEDNSGRSIE